MIHFREMFLFGGRKNHRGSEAGEFEVREMNHEMETNFYHSFIVRYIGIEWLRSTRGGREGLAMGYS